MKPFANESESEEIGKLTIENRTDRITMYGSLDITKDKPGLAAALELKAIVDQAVAALQGQQLPDQIAYKQTSEKKNPFRA